MGYPQNPEVHTEGSLHFNGVPPWEPPQSAGRSSKLPNGLAQVACWDIPEPQSFL